MENFRIKSVILIMCMLILEGCDEDISTPELDNSTQHGKSLQADWQFQYVVMDGDTITDFDYDGEPTIDEERHTDARLRTIRYNADKSYELITDNQYLLLGYWENYQPSFGYWDLMENNPDSLILTHNIKMPYEKSYIIMELNDSILVKRLIGNRITYLAYELDPLDYETLIVKEWIEIFHRKN